MSIDALKEKARRHERDEEWKEALALYLRAIEQLDGQGEPDVAVFNRAADLEVRLGQVETALDHYNRAIDLYLDADLPNNAIAICRKIVRHFPEEVEVFRRMGHIRAVQGFTVDARQHYLTYAELLQSRGGADEALAALEELVERVPSDWETRLLLAEGLLKHDRTEEAVAQLVAAWERLMRDGETDRAEALRGRIEELDPDVTLEVPVRPLPSHFVGAPPPGAVEGFESTAFEDSLVEEEADAPREDRPAEESWDEVPMVEGERWSEATPDEEGTPEAVSGETAPSEADEALEFQEFEAAPWEAEEAGEEESEPAAGSWAAEEAEPLESWTDSEDQEDDLPYITFPEADLPEPELAHPSTEEGPEAFETELEERETFGLEGAEEETSAALPEASDASEVGPPGSGVPETSPREDEAYVDLGSMILGEAFGERTTRWTVAAEEPSSDEGADFAWMLSQFKAKVSQNLEGEDARAQYDLGTAYKEMGLLEEAITMFQRALRMEPRHLAAMEMLGQCFLDRGEPHVAVRVLSRALDAGAETEDELVGIYYFLGKANEGVGNPERAREFFEKVFALDINFRDVTDRLRELR
jgi:tetratricopeptide (TPR) repeat protein